MSSATVKIDGVVRRIVSLEEWRQVREAMTEKEKAHMRAGDALAAERRRMPWMKMRTDYVFEGEGGRTSLVDLFGGRKQLILYHFMFGPEVEGWPDAGCIGCSFFADQVSHLDHIRARGVEFALVSSAPFANLERYRKRTGWRMPWYSTTDEFNRACDVSEQSGNSFGLSVFYRDGSDVYRTYFVARRGVEAFGTAWSFLDIVPFGRQESWQDAPKGTPQGDPYEWWRRHGEYEDLALADDVIQDAVRRTRAKE
jgi:predicted dithiol-disulfide oxidoreductase (DUF899 family)